MLGIAHRADVLGMIGVPATSTPVMKEDLVERNERGTVQGYLVIAGGAALTRAHVEQDLAEVAPEETAGRAPWWGSRITRGIPFADDSARLDERALFNAQSGLRSGRGGAGPACDERVETEGRPRLRESLNRVHHPEADDVAAR